MKLKIFGLSIAASLALTFGCGLVLNSEAADISDKLIRLHVVANSDTEEDQNLKLMVRDEILEYLTPRLSGLSSRADAEVLVSQEAENIKEIAERKISECGYDYTVTITLCEESFPTTEYSTFSLPAGEYLSLRIIIGEGNGHNWWCVVFPPVCTVTEFDESMAKAAGLTENEISLITYDDGYVVKFKAIEIIAKLKELIK